MVHALHEAVKVRTHLAVKRQGVIEGVDQIGLAAPHATPEIQSFNRLRLAFAQTIKQPRPGLVAGNQLVVQTLQVPDRPFLGRIMKEIGTLEVRLVSFQGRHARDTNRGKRGAIL